MEAVAPLAFRPWRRHWCLVMINIIKLYKLCRTLSTSTTSLPHARLSRPLVERRREPGRGPKTKAKKKARRRGKKGPYIALAWASEVLIRQSLTTAPHLFDRPFNSHTNIPVLYSRYALHEFPVACILAALHSKQWQTDVV